MSFYRIYRPQIIHDIDNVSVQEALLRLLEKPVADLPHAYLFHGLRGGGKTTSARLIAKIFNCTKPTPKGPCGTCEQCTSIAAGNNLDVMEIDAASNRGIDEIRQLRDGINLMPSSAKFKIYIIDEVHMLTTEAFNALLKTLEEPPAHAVFVLATTDPQKVPVTIKSRCVSISFTKASVTELTKALGRIVKKEKIDIDEAGLTLIAQNADGSFRDAVKALEQVSFHKGTVTQDVIRSVLSMSEENVRKEFIQFLLESDLRKSMAMIEKLLVEGKDLRTFLVESLKDLETSLMSDIREGKPSQQQPRVTHIIEVLSHAYGNMRNVPIPQLPLELAIVELCGPAMQAASNDQHVSVPQKSSSPVYEVPVAPVSVPTAHVMPTAQIDTPQDSGSLTLEYLTQHWADVIAELKPYNHSVAGVMRSTRPVSVSHGIVRIEAFYTFHKEKLSEGKTRDIIATVLKKLFGENVRIEIVLGKK